MTEASDSFNIDPPRWTARLTQFAFALLIVSVLARATMMETLRDPFEVSPGAQPFPRGLNAAGSFVLDWIGCIPALLVLLRRLLDGAKYPLRTSLSFAFILPLAAWTSLSAFWSSDRFAAVVGAAHFVSAAAVLWAAFQLVRTPTRLRIVGGACFGLLLTIVAAGLVYRFIELPDLQRSVDSNWPQILADRGWDADSFMARQFRQKINSGDMVGFNASPNTLAAMLVMLGIVSAGAAMQRIADKDPPGWPVIVAASFIPAAAIIWYTQSKAAFVTPVLAVIAFACIAILPRWLAVYRKAFFSAALILMLTAAGAIIVYGSQHNGLHNDSLTFRWRYWVGSARIIERHPIVGVGWNSFPDNYLPVREAAASEEIKDPHDLFIKFTVELGGVGLVLLIAWLTTFSYAVVRPPFAKIQKLSAREGDESLTLRQAGRAPIKVILSIAAGAMLFNSFASIDFAQDIAFVFIEVMKRVLYIALISGGLIVVAFRSVEHPALDDRPAPWIRAAGVVALFIFLLHNVIDFSFFETGSLWTFMLIGGAVLAATHALPIVRKQRNAAVGIGATLAFLGWVVSGCAIGVPLLLAESKAASADDLLRDRQAAPAAKLLLDAADTLPFSNADYLSRAAYAQIIAQRPPERVRETLARAMIANPQAAAYPRRLADFERRQNPPDRQPMQDAYERALDLNPNDVGVRLEYARALEAFGDRAAAAKEYLEAIRKNDLLDRAEPKRLPVTERDQIEAHAHQLVK